jgi:Tfp pilus assembly protein PilO
VKLSNRERRLAIITLTALLFGLTFWVGQPRYEEWKRNNEEVELLVRRQAAAQRLVEQTGELNQRLDVLREQLPQHPREADVTSQLLRNLQQFADQHGFLLLRREPEPERRIGDLYELAITCTWEGELPSLVHFLYALQTQGAIVDVRQLTITPVQGTPNRLRGTLIVDYAYSRATPGT